MCTRHTRLGHAAIGICVNNAVTGQLVRCRQRTTCTIITEWSINCWSNAWPMCTRNTRMGHAATSHMHELCCHWTARAMPTKDSMQIFRGHLPSQMGRHSKSKDYWSQHSQRTVCCQRATQAKPVRQINAMIKGSCTTKNDAQLVKGLLATKTVKGLYAVKGQHKDKPYLLPKATCDDQRIQHI